LRRFPILTRRYIEPFFMKFRGPQAPPKQTTKCDGLPHQSEHYWAWAGGVRGRTQRAHPATGLPHNSRVE